MIDDLKVVFDGEEKQLSEPMVTIPMSEFTRLVGMDIRAKVLLDTIAIEKTVSTVAIAYILGNAELAMEIKREADEENRRWMEKRYGKKGEANETSEIDS